MPGFTVAAGALKPPAVAAAPGLRTAGLLAVTGVSAGGWFLWRARPAQWPSWSTERIEVRRCQRLEELLAPVRQAGRVVAATLGLSLAIGLLEFAAIVVLARTAGLAVPATDVAIAGCIAYAAAMLPISIGGHGVREGALVLTLASLGLVAPSGPSRDAALRLALLWWAVTVAWGLAGGLVLLGGRRPARKTCGGAFPPRRLTAPRNATAGSCSCC